MERGEDGYVVGAYMFNCHPFSKTVFLAFDLAFRPADETESTS